MENYLFIDGKKIELSQETVENLKKALSSDDLLRLELENGGCGFLKGEEHCLIQIGRGCAPAGKEHLCLIVSKKLRPEIIENPDESSYPKAIIFHKL